MTDFKQVLHSDPDVLGGTPVFVEFLRQFPSVRREQAIAALDLARDSLLTGARPS